ncbi:esterase/lipase/thioesterase family protein [alpha proteobacterium U9-1i]|nr:esterase/lipase/thioesterase family protein [alpha proteobacterium U9-1i]
MHSRFSRRLFVAASAAGLIAPSLANAQQTPAPPASPLPSVREHLDLDYYTGPDADPQRHKLNLLVPPNASAERLAPVFAWFPGGAWATGSRRAETNVARRLANVGIATAAIDHRMSMNPFPETPQPRGVRHPAHINDCARATAWLIANAHQYNLDPNNVFIGGFSSGSHLAALMAMDPRYLAEVGVQRSQIRGAVPACGGFDLVRYYHNQVEEAGQAFADRHLMELGAFGSMEALVAASPNQYIAQSEIPMLVVSEGDTYIYNHWFEEEVAAANLQHLVSFRHFREHTHRSLFFELRDQEQSPVRDAIAGFINARRAA